MRMSRLLWTPWSATPAFTHSPDELWSSGPDWCGISQLSELSNFGKDSPRREFVETRKSRSNFWRAFVFGGTTMTKMNRRDLIKAMGSTAGAALLYGHRGSAIAATPRDRVNILFLMDDQHRGDCLGAAGPAWLKTPHLDSLAHEGALFVKTYTSTPSCLPARAALLTGKSPWRHGMLGYKVIPPRYEHEKPRMFTEAGYRTHAVGKMHFQDHDHGYQPIVLEEAWRLRSESFKCDYRRWFEAHHPDKDVDATGLSYTDHRGGRPFPYDDALHPTNWTAEQGIKFLQTYHGERPWLLNISFKRPHPPFDPPKR